MFLTERVGGSDLGATATTARRDGAAWRLDSDKWFCSNVGADLILTLARPEGAPPGTRGLGLFLVPRLLPDGGRNPYLIHRLKDKLGTRVMASGEVAFTGTMAYLIEPLERGFVMMMEMVNGTRLLRDAEVQVIREGGVNMASFDVLRTVEREDAWPVYAGAVERELALAAALGTALLADALHRALDRLNRLGERIDGWSHGAKEIAAPGLTETMSALYAAALLAAEASFAFKRSDDEGALALTTARRYHGHVLGPALDALARHTGADARSAADAANLIAAAVVR